MSKRPRRWSTRRPGARTLARAIVAAADEVIAGELDSEFPLSATTGHPRSRTRPTTKAPHCNAALALGVSAADFDRIVDAKTMVGDRTATLGSSSGAGLGWPSHQGVVTDSR
jgi:hypothetical protein